MKPFQIVFLTLSIMASHDLLIAAPPPGHVIEWGQNVGGGATGVPFPEHYYSTGTVTIAGTTLSNVIATAAGGGHCLALKR